MFILNGIGLNNGLCLGKAHLIKIDDFNVEFNSIDKKKIKSEIDRFYKAIEKTINYIVITEYFSHLYNQIFGDCEPINESKIEK